MVYVFQSRRSERNGFSLSAMTKTQKFFLWQTNIVQTFSQSMRTTFQNCYSDLFSYELNWFGAITRTLIPTLGMPAVLTNSTRTWMMVEDFVCFASRKKTDFPLTLLCFWLSCCLSDLCFSGIISPTHKCFTHTVAQLGNDLKVFAIINVGV